MKHDLKGTLAYFRESPGIFIFVLLVIIAGFVCGLLTTNFLDKSQLTDITSLVNNYFNNLKEEKDLLLIPSVLLRDAIIKNGGILILIWLMGLHRAGFILILPVVFLKGFSLGFTAAVFFGRYSLRGVLFCFAGLLPHNLFYVPVIVLAAVFAFAHSYYIYKNRVQKERLLRRPFFAQYCTYMMAILIVSLLGSLVEAYITPVFIRLILPVI